MVESSSEKGPASDRNRPWPPYSLAVTDTKTASLSERKDLFKMVPRKYIAYVEIEFEACTDDEAQEFIEGELDKVTCINYDVDRVEVY